MSHASQQYAFTEPRTVKRAQVKPSEREHQTSSSAPRVSLAPAADRTLDILEFIASNGQTQAATLARELGIPRSTVYQLLEILERHGLVTRLTEQRAYGIGLKTFELGSAYSRQHRVSQVAHPVLARLVDETGENGHLAVLHGNEIIYVIEERAAHRPPLVSGVGVRLPSPRAISQSSGVHRPHRHRPQIAQGAGGNARRNPTHRFCRGTRRRDARL